MKILLLAPDSKVPNLALMKLAAHHKALGDEVSTSIVDPDLIYVSLIFTWNRHYAESIKFMHPGIKVIPGGPGYDPSIKLPSDVEQTPPDRSIYEPDGYTYGRVTSGCTRRCHFCMVHVQEPDGIRYIQHPKDIWVQGTTLRLFDDNILAHPEAWNELYHWALENDIRLHLEYLDIRLITPKIALQLHQMKHDGNALWFAFDFTHIENAVRQGVATLRDIGFNGRSLRFFLYCHDEMAVEDAKYRWKVLIELGCEPFLMVNIFNRTGRLKRLQRRCTRPATWRGANAEKLFDLNARKSDNLSG